MNTRTIALAAVVALGVVALAFSWDRAVPERAQAASQGSAVAMELRVPANAEVGSKFTIEVAGNLTPANPIAVFGLDIITGAGVSYNGAGDCLAEVKVRNVGGGEPALCLSRASVAGGHFISVVSQLSAPPLTELDVATDAKVALANLSYSCDTLGTTKITLTHESVDPDGAVFGRASDSARLAVKSETQDSVAVADSASITCTATPTATPTNTPPGQLTATPTNTPPGQPTATPTNTPPGPGTPTKTPMGPTSMPTDEPPTPTPTKQPSGDTDNDGCLDTQENSLDETLGGRRDYLNFWDFYDPNRDRSVSLLDFLAVLARLNSVGDPNIDPLSPPPPPPAYHPLFDRGGQTPGSEPWAEQPPNGSIGLPDFLSLLRQFGHTCA